MIPPKHPVFTKFPLPNFVRYDGDMGDGELQVSLFTDQLRSSPAFGATFAIRTDRLSPATLLCKLAAKRAEFRTQLSPACASSPSSTVSPA